VIKPFALIVIGYSDGRKSEFADRCQAGKVLYGKYLLKFKKIERSHKND